MSSGQSRGDVEKSVLSTAFRKHEHFVDSVPSIFRLIYCGAVTGRRSLAHNDEGGRARKNANACSFVLRAMHGEATRALERSAVLAEKYVWACRMPQRRLLQQVTESVVYLAA